MLKNATYDLMETASVLSTGLHRYDTFRTDASHCAQCQEMELHEAPGRGGTGANRRHLAHYFQDELKVRLSARS